MPRTTQADRAATVLTVMVPCQFGPGGRHPVTVVANVEDAVVGFRTGCDNLPEEVEATGVALAADEASCCRSVKRAMIKAIVSNTAYVTRDVKRHLHQHELFERMLDEWLIYAAGVRNKRRDARPDAVPEMFSFTTKLTEKLRQATGGLPLTVAVERSGNKPKLTLVVVDQSAIAPERVVAAYRGGGVWVMSSRWKTHVRKLCERVAVLGSSKWGKCSVCGTEELKNLEAHRQSARHVARTTERVEQFLADAATNFCRARASAGG